MTALRSVLLSVLVLALTAASGAVVGGQDADPGEYPAVAEITFGPFLCTGTLISPTWVLSAGHCSSITGALVATPASYPPALINVRIGGVSQDDGETVPVSQVVMHPDYLLTSGYDTSLLQLTRASSMAPSQVAGAERSIWDPGDLETIVGWGATEEGGDLPDRLQEARVPITTDPYCAGAYSDFDPVTMVCAGFPEGGVEVVSGRLGRPDVRHHRWWSPARGGHDELRRGLRPRGQAGRVRARGGCRAARVDPLTCARWRQPRDRALHEHHDPGAAGPQAARQGQPQGQRRSGARSAGGCPTGWARLGEPRARERDRGP